MEYENETKEDEVIEDTTFRGTVPAPSFIVSTPAVKIESNAGLIGNILDSTGDVIKDFNIKTNKSFRIDTSWNSTNSLGSIHFRPANERLYLAPTSGRNCDLGYSTVSPWDNVSYVTLIKVSGFGFFDKGVELQDGKIVSDVEALLQMKENPNEKTPYGKTIIDKTSLPKAVYKQAYDKDGLLPRDPKTKKAYIEEKKNGKIVKRTIEDGEDVNAMMSIMIGAIRELGERINKLEI